MILTLELPDDKIQALLVFAENRRKNINTIISEFIDFVTKSENKTNSDDIANDPLFAIKTRETNETKDLSEKFDKDLNRKSKRPRKGWEEAFRLMAKNGDDRLLDDNLANQSSWDDTEWEW